MEFKHLVKELPKPDAAHVWCEVLRPFVGNYEDDPKTGNLNKKTGEGRYANASGIIPRGFAHQTKRHMVKPHIIQLTEARFRELSKVPEKGSKIPIVRAYDPEVYAQQMMRGRYHSERPAQAQPGHLVGVRDADGNDGFPKFEDWVKGKMKALAVAKGGGK